MLSIRLNGEHHACAPTTHTVSELVDELSLAGKRVAIERNGEIVPRSRHSATTLLDGDKIEVVAAVGGG